MALSLPLKRSISEYRNISSGSHSVTVSSPSDLIFISGCSNCELFVSTKGAKLVIEKCKNTTVTVSVAPVSGTLEVVNCEGLTVVMSVLIHTLTVDLSRGVHLLVPSEFGLSGDRSELISASCTDLTIQVAAHDGRPPFSVTASESTTQVAEPVEGGGGGGGGAQWVTRRRSQGGSVVAAVAGSGGSGGNSSSGGGGGGEEEWVTVELVREGAGYHTTAADKAVADAREERALAAFQARVAEDRAAARAPPPAQRSGSGRQIGGSLMGSSSAAASSSSSGGAASQRSSPGRGGEAGEPASANGGNNNNNNNNNNDDDDDDDKSAVRSGGAGLLSSIRGFARGQLKPATTVERTMNSVVVIETEDRQNWGHASDADIKEYFDPPAEVEAKVEALAAAIRASSHVVAYTGAGVSTSAKIPDYRGPSGAWTLRAKGLQAKMDITLEQAIPTPTHMTLVAMRDAGHLAHTVSTNVDGLHRRSGLTADDMSELHGNTYREVCSVCSTEYLRRFEVGCQRRDHKTGRVCSQAGCGGDLQDSIINFGENLPQGEYTKAFEHSRDGDFALVLGTSMGVSPACNLPGLIYKKGPGAGAMAIVNLQKTPFDNYAAIRIFAKTDEVMTALAAKLGLTVPVFDPTAEVREEAVIPNSSSARC